MGSKHRKLGSSRLFGTLCSWKATRFPADWELQTLQCRKMRPRTANNLVDIDLWTWSPPLSYLRSCPFFERGGNSLVKNWTHRRVCPSWGSRLTLVLVELSSVNVVEENTSSTLCKSASYGNTSTQSKPHSFIYFKMPIEYLLCAKHWGFSSEKWIKIHCPQGADFLLWLLLRAV